MLLISKALGFIDLLRSSNVMVSILLRFKQTYICALRLVHTGYCAESCSILHRFAVYRNSLQRNAT